MSSVRYAVQLLVLAVVCYGLSFALAPREDNIIEVTPAMTDAMAEQQEAILGRPLTDAVCLP